MSRKVTNRKAAEKVSYNDFYRNAESVGENFNAILDTLPVSIIRMKNWKVTWCNHYAEKMFDLEADDLNGLKFKDLFESQEDYKRFLKNSRSDKKKNTTSAVKYDMRSGEGGSFKAALALSYNGKENKTKKSEVVATILDLTDSCTCKVVGQNPADCEKSDYPELAACEESLKGTYAETPHF
jgi:PAS domain-containing protein